MTSASRSAKEVCDDGRGVGDGGRGVYLDFRDAIQRLGKRRDLARYGNLFEMYERITGENPYEVPMRIYPASHYTMGGLWVDYNLMSTSPGLFVLGEANFSDHGANRLGASALMQGLADGYFVFSRHDRPLPRLELHRAGRRPTHPEFARAKRRRPVRAHRQAAAEGQRQALRGRFVPPRARPLMWDKCGMARNAAGLRRRWSASRSSANGVLEERASSPAKAELAQPGPREGAGRVADFLEFAELMCRDALERDESCGGHFREEHQTEEGEAVRNDADYCYVSAWEFKGVGEDADAATRSRSSSRTWS